MTHQPVDVQTIGSLSFSEYLQTFAYPQGPSPQIAWLIVWAAIAIGAALTMLRVQAREGVPAVESRLEAFGTFMLLLLFACLPLLATAGTHSAGAPLVTGKSLERVEQTYGLSDDALDWVNHTSSSAERESRVRLAPQGQAQLVDGMTLQPGRWGVELERSQGVDGSHPQRSDITSVRVVVVDADGRTSDLRQALLDASRGAR